MTVAWGIRGYSVRVDAQDGPLRLRHAAPVPDGRRALGDPATSPASLAVGALCWQSRQPEFYTSQGPTIDGRMKPDLVGHDSVSGATYGPFSSCPSGFAGTSAAAPEVAGAAALVQAGVPRLRSRPAPAVPREKRSRHGSRRDGQRHGRRRAPAAKGTGCRPANGPRAREHGSRRQDGQAPLGHRGQRGRGKRGRAGEAERQGRQDAQAAGIGRGDVSQDRRHAVGSARQAEGAFQHCAVAVDAAGNRSPESCARIVLR